MDFGIMTAKIDEIGYITHAENLGYRNCWVTDSPMIRSNCWAVLALAAQATRTMRLGTGVAVPPLRLAPVTANGIATINRLAPFREYVDVVRGLLRGDEVAHTSDGETHPIRFQMREHRFIDLDHPIPIYIAAFGPKAQALAGEIGDGLISGMPRGGTVSEMLANARRGAAKAGRTRHQRLHASHYSFVDPEEARFITADLIRATCLSGTPEELVAQIRQLERDGLHALSLYPPLNRQYRVIEDFAERVMARL